MTVPSSDELNFEQDDSQGLDPTPDEDLTQSLNAEAQTQETQEKLWMIPFADLMSTLVILFLALFGYAYLGASTEYELAIAKLQKEMTEDEQSALEKNKVDVSTAQSLELSIDEEKLKGLVDVKLYSENIKISLSNPVLFETGQAALKPEAARALGIIGDAIKKSGSAVIVEGHTDVVPVKGGPYKSNFELSAARAFSVIDYFIRLGLDPARFSAYGYGEYRPVAGNDTEEGRQQNRRIEINITRKTTLS
jgi:chemotaxis protein MotB